MPQLKYKDPADGLWKPVPVGGSAAVVPNEVTIDAAEPTDGSELWLDTDEPAVPLNAVTKPQADTDYVNVVGDAMTGQLGLVAPTLITNAARWADGVPRFATAAARDAAYVTIGGPVQGMRCHQDDIAVDLTYWSGAWFSSQTISGSWRGYLRHMESYSLTDLVNWSPVWTDLTQPTSPPVRKVNQTSGGFILPPEASGAMWIASVQMNFTNTVPPPFQVHCWLVSNPTAALVSGQDIRYVSNQWTQTVTFTFRLSTWVDTLQVVMRSGGAAATVLNVLFSIQSV